MHATYRGTSGQLLQFDYVVTSGDLDVDGISIRRNALSLNGATIRSTTGVAANLDLGSHAINNASGHKVRGSIATTPTVSSVAVVGTPASGDTYGAGEAIFLKIGFTVPVNLAGNAELVLTIGSVQRFAGH